MKFVQFEIWRPMDAQKAAYAAEEKIGHYFTRYDSETGEGSGWFGTADEPMYDFRREIIDGELAESTRGYGQGCFWSEWRV